MQFNCNVSAVLKGISANAYRFGGDGTLMTVRMKATTARACAEVAIKKGGFLVPRFFRIVRAFSVATTNRFDRDCIRSCSVLANSANSEGRIYSQEQSSFPPTPTTVLLQFDIFGLTKAVTASASFQNLHAASKRRVQV